MIKSGLYHEMNMNYVYALDKNHMVFKLKTAKDDIKRATICYIDKFLGLYKRSTITSKEMTYIGTSGEHDYYETVLKLDVISLRYYFEVEDHKLDVAYYCEKDIYEEEPTNLLAMFDTPQQARVEELFDIPKWMKEGIVYQIFPDRFYRVDFQDQDKFDPWDSKVKWNSMLGGSIAGITKKLDYLSDLGITVIYLNPIFLSPSNHKYDTTDYYEIDPTFGTKDDFKEMIDKAHERNIKVVIDGVFNHCGIHFFAFQDVMKNQEASLYKDWFHIYSFPIDTGYKKNNERTKPSYDTFGYYGGMPKLNMSNHEVRDYIFKLTTYWTKNFKIDGWRLDASDEVSFDFWKAFRKHIKSMNSEIGIIGEIWYDASSWLLGDQYDSVMNYKFRTPVVDFIANKTINATSFNNHIQFTRTHYKQPVSLGLWNLIGSHDTARFLTLCNQDRRRFKMAVALQFALQGNPVIYYGDEIGMYGDNDPDCRKGMLWDEQEQDLDIFNYYKTLIKLRKDMPLLINGEYKCLFIDNHSEILVFERFNKEDRVMIAVNNSDKVYKWKSIETLINLVTKKSYNDELEPFSVTMLQSI